MSNQLTNLARSFWSEVEVYRSVMMDQRCPRIARWLIGGALAYALSPIDLIPDFIPLIGHLDDAIILPLLIWLALRTIPKELMDEHRKNGVKSALDPW